MEGEIDISEVNEQYAFEKYCEEQAKKKKCQFCENEFEVLSICKECLLHNNFDFDEEDYWLDEEDYYSDEVERYDF